MEWIKDAVQIILCGGVAWLIACLARYLRAAVKIEMPEKQRAEAEAAALRKWHAELEKYEAAVRELHRMSVENMREVRLFEKIRDEELREAENNANDDRGDGTAV